jgi:hypothetical protein
MASLSGTLAITCHVVNFGYFIGITSITIDKSSLCATKNVAAQLNSRLLNNFDSLFNAEFKSSISAHVVSFKGDHN